MSFKASLGYIVSSRRIWAPELRLNLRGGCRKEKEEEEEKRRKRGGRKGWKEGEREGGMKEGKEEGREGGQGKEEIYNGQSEFGKRFQIG